MKNQTANTNENLLPYIGKNVRVRANAGDQWANKRGVVVDTAGGNVYGVQLNGFTGTVDFATRELTVLN